ncbi:hypothetical protein [Candidatus Finniella inopinata]|uniref:Uncharacterized protein n=1 Tax=Candidatus Finniella inopinata TaxID=1696036 RepID=A0A4Q7DGH6_9PROT|nr:hypothetical protein [Candidatus Finniella inopinata]RZI45298.1 hypothetical protein EQU50_07615 [Candidatus Finniella inopinata]
MSESDSDSDVGSEFEEVEEPESPNEVPQDVPLKVGRSPRVEGKIPSKKRPSKIDPATGDKRKETSKINLAKARQARIDKLKLQKELGKPITTGEPPKPQGWEPQSETSSEEEIVIARKPKKKKVMSATTERLLKLELAFQQMALRAREKKERKTVGKPITEATPAQEPTKEPTSEVSSAPPGFAPSREVVGLPTNIFGDFEKNKMNKKLLDL